MCLFCENTCDICFHHFVCKYCQETTQHELTQGYCPTCVRNHFRTCKGCSVSVHSDDGHFTNGSFYCSDCAEEFACTECGSKDYCAEIYGSFYCEDCINEYWFVCESCGDYTSNDDSFYSEVTECSYCSHCYNELFFTCDGCGGEYSYDDYARDGYCNICYDDGDEYREVGDPIYSNRFDRLPSKRLFGIEIETDSGDYSNTPEEWGIKDDGSINGKELVSPIMQGDDGIESIEELYRNVRPSFDRRCGIHVHINTRDMKPDEKYAVIKAFKATKSRWWDYVDSSRHRNHYCCGDIPEIKEGESWVDYVGRAAHDRYVWCNLDALCKHGTIEIRLLEGTSNVKKVTDWVVMLLTFVDTAINVHNAMKTMEVGV